MTRKVLETLSHRLWELDHVATVQTKPTDRWRDSPSHQQSSVVPKRAWRRSMAISSKPTSGPEYAPVGTGSVVLAVPATV